MSNHLTPHEKELLASLNSGRSREELFSSIAKKMQDSHDHEITEATSRDLARNFIGFCQKWIEVEIRLDDERANDQQNVN